jgi:tetratricopeptide (TPR) repeat protein
MGILLKTVSAVAAAAIAILIARAMLVERAPQPPAEQIPAATASSILIDQSASTQQSIATSLPERVLIQNDYKITQTFNNCSAAALSFALRYHGIYESQADIARAVRPYNNPQGKNDDKSTTPEELAEYAKKHGLVGYYRPNGTIETFKKFVAAGIPVIVRSTLTSQDDYGHYRVVRGYDEPARIVIQDDGIDGNAIRFSYDEFLKIWKPFNYAYLVVVKPEQEETVKRILGDEADLALAWQRARARAEKEITENPDDIFARFNLAVAAYYAGDYEASVRAFEAAESKLGKHMLWYQMEPMQAYFELGDYDRVFALTEKVFASGNPSASELYLIRGESYLKLGKPDLAKKEFEKALFYNIHLPAAKAAMARVQ